jgi:hypothetical protein
MIPKPLNEIVEADILQLKASGVEEGATIEYKRDLPGTKDEDKREFLADVSSFANTDGGDIVYGVIEDQGVITDVIGTTCPDFDTEVLRLESLVRDGIAPRISIAIATVPSAAGRILLVRVEKSWNGPHRVIFRGHDKFYARTSAGKFPLDVSQLRSAFLQSGTLAEKINAFRVDRLVDISNDRAPMPLAKLPMTILHIVPLGSLSDQPEYDVARFVKNPILHRPWNSSGWEPRMTFDGALLYKFVNEEGRVSGYTHFYRNGILEVATTLLLRSQYTQVDVLTNVSFEGELLNYLPKCF